MHAADLFVSVSHFEGLPNAVMEAAACGMALVLSDIAGHRELLGDEAAWFVNQSNVREIAATITGALQNEDERATRGAAAKSVRQWTIEAMAAEYAHIYGRVLEGWR